MILQEFHELCRRRQSLRSFDAKPLARSDIETLIDIASLSPSVENTQPWHFHVIMNADLQQKMLATACYGNFVGNASALIIVTCDRQAHPTSREIIWNPRELEYSCASAMTYLTLAATAMGCASCWVSLHHGAAHDTLRPQNNHTIIGGMLLGYPQVGDVAVADHKRVALQQIITVYE